jgi:hypothetical protein
MGLGLSLLMMAGGCLVGGCVPDGKMVVRCSTGMAIGTSIDIARWYCNYVKEWRSHPLPYMGDRDDLLQGIPDGLEPW